MDCLLDEIYKLKKFKKKHPRVHEFDDAPSRSRAQGKKKKGSSTESMKDRMARLRSMRGKK